MSQRNNPLLPITLGLLLGMSGGWGTEGRDRFHFVPAWEAERTKLFQPQLLRFGPHPPEPLEAEPEYRGTPRYAAWELGNGRDPLRTCVLIPSPRGPDTLYVDANNDNAIQASEKVPWREEVYPLRRGAEGGWERGITYEVVEGEETRRVQGRALLVPGSRGPTAQAGLRGYAEGILTLADGGYPARLVDGNGNGLFHENGVDRLWLDLNQDGVWETGREQWILQPVGVFEEHTYSLQVRAQGDRMEAQVEEKGTSRIQFALGPDHTATPQVLAATLVSAEGEVFPVREVSKPMTVPAGEYRVSAVTLVLQDERSVWRYQFSGGRSVHFPLVVPPDSEQKIDLLGPLTLRLEVSGPPQPGQTLIASVHLMAATGLEMITYIEGGTGERSDQQAADLWLRNAAGQTMARTRTGFT